MNPRYVSLENIKSCQSIELQNFKHVYRVLNKREMLTGALRALVKNPVKESFYGKKKKKTINILTVFFISQKNNVKTFLK